MDATADTRTEGPELLVSRVQELQEALDASGDSATRDLADELVAAIVQLYGEGLERIIGTLLSRGEDGLRLASALTDDPLVSTLLLIHDLHPVPLADRVQAALDSVRPYMESHGGNVELLSLEDGVARINLKGSCSDCSASAVTLELAIKQALEDAAPDLAGLEVEGVSPQIITGTALPMAGADAGAPTGLELPVVMSGGTSLPRAPSTPAPPAWFEIGAFDDVLDGQFAAVTVAQHELVIANVDGTLLAYEDRCAGCGGPLHVGSLVAGALTCPQCENGFSLARAGRSLGDGSLQLRPVPLLRDRGGVKVALAG
jgi:Fe-S cluster biogenesis protein NfuA/nitrite reductase/ring-hydroxylating ferredoxin subunit